MMPRFNLNDYETVEERIRRFYDENPDGRIETENLTTPVDRSVATWVVRASIFLTAGDQANRLPKATGLAFEVDGGQGANQTAALENAETSAIGRGLKNAGIGKSVSRDEMEKVNRGVTPTAPGKNWLQEADKITDVGGLRWLYAQAKTEGASPETLERIEERAKVLGASGEGEGADGSLPISVEKG
jgi:hypothetical protein